MVHTHARMIEGKKILQMNSTKECFYIYILYQETVTTEYDYTSQVKTAAET